MTFWLTEVISGFANTEVISGLIAEVSIFLAMLDIDEPQQAPEIEAGTQTTGDNAFASARSTHTCSELNQQFRLYLMAGSAIRQNGAIRPPEPFQADPDLGRGGTDGSLLNDQGLPVPRSPVPCSPAQNSLFHLQGKLPENACETGLSRGLAPLPTAPFRRNSL